MSESRQSESAQSVTDITELCKLLDLPQDIANQGLAAAQQYPLLVSRSFVNRMEKGNPDDPLLLQILPQQEELRTVKGFTADPLEEIPPALKERGLNDNNYCVLQKYAGRALILTTDKCGIHCRFCFRRHTLTSSGLHTGGVAADGDISEIILSGGDPLTLPDNKLFQLMHRIRENPNIKRIRIHTRLPVVQPSRITPEFIEGLIGSMPSVHNSSVIYIVLHINHPNELSDEFFERILQLREVVLLSQTVLLKGVNDNADVLTKLFEMLTNYRIVPYYLHQLDKVQGAAHFEVSPLEGLKIMTQLDKRLPGYAVPKYVREVPNEAAKISMNVPIEQFH